MRESPAFPPAPVHISVGGHVLAVDRPLVMGILNLTPDSFSDGGRYTAPDAARARVEQLLRQGASIVDVGGASSRPGAKAVPVTEELQRLLPILPQLVAAFPQAVFSVDTWRARVAEEALAAGVHIVNDISGGRWEPDILNVVARHRVPYVLMHAQGQPAEMQTHPTYTDVGGEVHAFFVERLNTLTNLGIHDIILDPGFGFGKTRAHNYELLAGLGAFRALGRPILVGISRKSMLRELAQPGESTLPAATALHLAALQAGARILRVHDVPAALQAVRVFEALAPSAPV